MFFFKKVQVIFKILGICPTSLSPADIPSIQSCFLTIWTLIQMILLAFLCAVASWNTRVFLRESPVNQTTSLLKEVLVFGVHFTVIIQSLYARKDFHKFWKEIEKIHAFTSKFNDTADKTKVNWKQILVFIAYFLVTIILNIIIIVSFKKDPALLHHWLCMLFSMLISSFHHLQYSFYLETLYIYLVIITDELSKIVAQSKYNRSVCDRAITDTTNLLHNFYQVRKVYHRLWITHGIVNKIFGFGFMVNIAYMFVAMISDLYWVYVLIYNNTFVHIVGKTEKKHTFQKFPLLNFPSNFVLCSEDLLLSIVISIFYPYLSIKSADKCLEKINELNFMVNNIKRETNTELNVEVCNKS